VRLFSPRMSHIRQPAAPPSLEIEPGLPPRISFRIDDPVELAEDPGIVRVCDLALAGTEPM